MTTPERIKVEPAGDWADVWDASDEARVGTGAEVLYVRADIYANAVAERDRLRADLDAQTDWFWSCPLPMSAKPLWPERMTPANFGQPLRQAGGTLIKAPDKGGA